MDKIDEYEKKYPKEEFNGRVQLQYTSKQVWVYYIVKFSCFNASKNQ